MRMYQAILHLASALLSRTAANRVETHDTSTYLIEDTPTNRALITASGEEPYAQGGMVAATTAALMAHCAQQLLFVADVTGDADNDAPCPKAVTITGFLTALGIQIDSESYVAGPITYQCALYRLPGELPLKIWESPVPLVVESITEPGAYQVGVRQITDGLRSPMVFSNVVEMERMTLWNDTTGLTPAREPQRLPATNAIPKPPTPPTPKQHFAIWADTMTLGGLIDALTEMPQQEQLWFDFGLLVPKPDIASYRGDYSHLAIGWHTGAYEDHETTVATLLKALRKAIGHEYEGYKGGEYTASRNTPVWAAQRGEASDTCIIGVSSESGGVIIHTAHASRAWQHRETP